MITKRRYCVILEVYLEIKMFKRRYGKKLMRKGKENNPDNIEWSLYMRIVYRQYL